MTRLEETRRAIELTLKARRSVERLERRLFSLQAQEATQARIKLREAHQHLVSLSALLGDKGAA